MTILILGGTTEASTLARLLAEGGVGPATLSLAGRTLHPAPQPIPIRSGGFGGIDGLATYLREHRIGAVIDATHPFAAQMKRHAAAAAAQIGTPLLAIVRPEWRPQAGDRWRPVPDMPAAADAIGAVPRRVLLTIGQQDLLPFIATPLHRYVVRTVEPPALLPANATLITARGPFAEPDERRLLTERQIDILVTKNSGGDATRAKLDAARALGLDVIMVERPPLPQGVDVVRTAEAAFAWLLFHVFTPRGE